jgi:hypothetical protein
MRNSTSQLLSPAPSAIGRNDHVAYSSCTLAGVVSRLEKIFFEQFNIIYIGVTRLDANAN